MSQSILIQKLKEQLTLVAKSLIKKIPLKTHMPNLPETCDQTILIQELNGQLTLVAMSAIRKTRRDFTDPNVLRIAADSDDLTLGQAVIETFGRIKTVKKLPNVEELNAALGDKNWSAYLRKNRFMIIDTDDQIKLDITSGKKVKSHIEYCGPTETVDFNDLEAIGKTVKKLIYTYDLG